MHMLAHYSTFYILLQSLKNREVENEKDMHVLKISFMTFSLMQKFKITELYTGMPQLYCWFGFRTLQ